MEVFTPGFERDEKTGALLNADRAALIRHKQKIQQSRKIVELEKTCAELRSDVNKLKDALGLLLNKSA